MNAPKKLPSHDPKLKKTIGIFSGSNILMGIMIGSGIFYIGSYVLQRSDMSMGLALLAWSLGGLVTLLGSLCFAELGAMKPATGGIYIYLSDTYSPIVGYMFNFQSMIIGGPGSIAAVAVALPVAFKTLLSISDLWIKVIATTLIIIFTIINVLGVEIGKIIQNGFNVLKILPLILIIILGIFGGKYNVHFNINVGGTGSSPFTIIKMVSFATIASLWAYEGWTNLNTIAGEMKNPQKSLPRALLISVNFTIIIYLLFNLAIYRTLSFNHIQNAINNGQVYLGTDVAKHFMGTFGNVIVAISMGLAMISSLNGMILAFSRYYYAAAKDGLLWRSFAHVHHKFKTPDVSLWMQMLLSITLVWSRNLNQLTSLVVFSEAIFNVLTIIAVPLMRIKHPNVFRPYKVWGYPWTIVIATISFLIILLNNFVDDPVTSLVGLAIPLVGGIVYWLFKHYYHPSLGGSGAKL